MAMPILMKITANGEDVAGISTRAGHDDGTWSDVEAFNHRIEIPYDHSTGLSTGRRVHDPMKLTKRVDEASPFLYKAMTMNERCNVELHWFRHNRSAGGEEHFFTTVMEEANIIGITQEMRDDHIADNKKVPYLETIEIAFHKITWECLANAASHVDSHDDLVS